MKHNLAGRALRVHKLRYDRSPVFQWNAYALEHTPEHVLLAGLFGAVRRDLGYVVLERGDLFLEWYYFDRWYNIFQVYGTAGQLKGWYCNVGMPPEIVAGDVHYVDLALDVFVHPDGRYLVLDEDEFAVLKDTVLHPEHAALAEAGLAELCALVECSRLPSRPYDPADAAHVPRPPLPPTPPSGANGAAPGSAGRTAGAGPSASGGHEAATP
jgi:protein associated with RNAse G/E